MKRVDEAGDLRDKTILLRLDLNMPIKSGKFVDLIRLQRSLDTISYLIQQRAKIVIISHMGRPKGKFVRGLSLATVVDEIAKLVDRQVKFATDCIGEKVRSKIASMSSGEIILLENVRFHTGEEQNDDEFSSKLAELGDVFVNDAFSCSHRSHASIAGVTKFLPSFAGFALVRELDNLGKLLINPQRNFSALVGGAKIATKIKVLSKIISKVDNLILGGGVANTFLWALGHKLGNSLIDNNYKNEALDVIAQAKDFNTRILLPEDFIVKNSQNKISIKKIDDILPNEAIMDTGPYFSVKAAEIVHKSNTVVWNGAFGVIEYPEYIGASSYVARHIASRTLDGSLKSIIGGGDTAGLFQTLGLIDCVTYISTGGGAFLACLEGADLPGVNSLYNE